MTTIFKTKEQNIFVTFLELLQIKHTEKYSNKIYGEHPHKYNLFGLSKMLSDYGIENAGLKFKDKDDIFDIQTPFIAHIGNEFVIVSKITTEHIIYIWKGKNITLPIEKFNKMWTGVVLVAEASKQSIEPNYKNNKKEELFDVFLKRILVVFTGILATILYITQSIYTNWGLTLALAVNFIGIYTGYLFILKQMHIRSQYADKICSLFKQGDCNNILESKAAKFLGVISWSEIGLGYFISNAIVILFLPQLISYLAIINFCVLPYSFWSVWYQKFSAKQWCPLCLIVQVLLWAIFIIDLLFGFAKLPVWNLTNILLITCIYLLPFLVTGIIVDKFSKARKVIWLIQEINSIKADENVFEALLKKQPYYKVDKSTSSILWGNPNATILVTVFTNPHCFPCTKMHARIEKLLKEEHDNLCIQYIFSSFNAALSISNKNLIASYLNNESELRKIIFHEWFKDGTINKDELIKKYSINSKDVKVEEEFLRHEKWKEDTGLRATPTVLVNGYKLPDNYKIEDLRYFFKLDL
jgi:hypothetical protein